MDFVIKKILGYTSLLNFRPLRFFIEGCVSCSSFLGDERIIFASRWWKADEIRTRSWQNGGKCCEIVNSSNWYFYTWSINDWLLLISACFGELDQFSRDAYQVVIQIRARSCSYVGFTRDRLGSTGKKTTGAIMIILDSRTRLNFIKLHSTLFFFTRKVSMVIYIEGDWALFRSQNGDWHSITCLCYYAAKTRSRTMTVIAFSR